MLQRQRHCLIYKPPTDHQPFTHITLKGFKSVRPTTTYLTTAPFSQSRYHTSSRLFPLIWSLSLIWFCNTTLQHNRFPTRQFPIYTLLHCINQECGELTVWQFDIKHGLWMQIERSYSLIELAVDSITLTNIYDAILAVCRRIFFQHRNML